MLGFYYIISIFRKIYKLFFDKNKCKRIKLKKIEEQYIYPSSNSIGLNIDNLDF